MQRMELENQARKKNNEAMEKAADESAASARNAKCAQAKQALDLLQRQERIFTTGEDGRRVYLDDAARAAAIDRAKKVVNDNCGA